MQSWQSAPVIGQPAAQPSQAPAPRPVQQQPVQQPQQPRRIYGAPEAPKQPEPPNPKNIFRTMSPEEVKSAGLQPGGVYQVNGLGDINVVQAPTKTENGPQPTAAAPRERLARIYTALDNLRGLEGKVSSTDMATGSIVGQESFRAGQDYAGLSGFFNQTANDVAGGIEMVQGDLINQIRNEMQQSGAPIGAKGADTEKEASRLAASIANLAQTQDESEFLVGLGRAREYYIRRLAATVEELRGAGEEIPGNAILKDLLDKGGTKDELLLVADALNLNVNQDQLDANLRSRDQGGGTSQFVTPGGPPPSGPSGGGGGGGVAATSLGNTLVGYAQGAGEALIDFPLTASAAIQSGGDAILDTVVGGGLDAIGATDAANTFRRAGQDVRARRDQLSTPVQNAFNALAPAPAGYETQRDVARFAGGFLVPGPKGARPPVSAPRTAAQTASRPGVIDNAAQVVAEGQRRGVPVFTTDVKPPNSGMGRFAKQTLPEKIPLAGTSGPRQAQQEERVRVVGEVLEEFGGNASRELFDNSASAVEDIAKTLGAERSRRLSVLTGAKNSVIDGVQAPFNAAPNTVQAIQQEVRKLQAIDPEEFAPVIDRLQRFGERLTSGASLRVVEEQRKLLGELFTDPNLSRIKTRGQQSLNAIYDPLRKDMGNFIEAQAGAGARNRWSKANEELAGMAGELKSTRFRNVLRDTDTTPEAVGRILFGDGDNVSDVKRLVENLPPAGKKKVQAALLQRAFDKAGGSDGVSVEQFLNNLGSLSKKIGVAFDGQDRQALEGVRRLLEATRRGAAAGANIRTGEQNLPTILGIGATQALGAAGGIGTLGVGGLLARVYESPMMRNHILRLATTKAGTPAESKAMQLLMRSAAPIVAQWRESLPRALNDNPASRLAAEEQPNEPQ
jgi:hypothetical protein